MPYVKYPVDCASAATLPHPSPLAWVCAGDIVQLDISDPAHPVVKGRVFVGGLIRKGSPIKVLS
jgi:hypothetical protein